MTEDQITALLGPPSGRRLPGSEAGRRATARVEELEQQTLETFYPRQKMLRYNADQSPLPRPIRSLELLLEDGKCKQVLGHTTDFTTPEALLNAIGLGHLNRTVTQKDVLGFNYRIPPFEIVQIGRPANWAPQYSTFNVAGYTPATTP